MLQCHLIRRGARFTMIMTKQNVQKTLTLILFFLIRKVRSAKCYIDQVTVSGNFPKIPDFQGLEFNECSWVKVFFLKALHESSQECCRKIMNFISALDLSRYDDFVEEEATSPREPTLFDQPCVIPPKQQGKLSII